MSLTIGQEVYVPCEVKKGPFSNERLARTNETEGAWVGFIQECNLKPPIKEGATTVRAVVMDVRPDRRAALVFIHGEALINGNIWIDGDTLKPIDQNTEGVLT